MRTEEERAGDEKPKMLRRSFGNSVRIHVKEREGDKKRVRIGDPSC